MKIERLFHVLVVAGASSTAGFGCSTDTTGGNDGGGTGATSSGTGGEDSGAGATGSGGSMGTGGSKGSGGSAGSSGAPDASTGDGGMCEAVCHKSTTVASWIDCNGCCCWLPIGTMAPAGSPTCGEEPCCIGRGRTK